MGAAEWAELIIRLGVSLVMVGFGAHQLIKPAAWREYIPAWLDSLLPTSADTFMRTHGFGNLALGILFAIGLWKEATTWVVLVWWLTILPFTFYVNWRNGLRDSAIICGIAAVLLLV